MELLKRFIEFSDKYRLIALCCAGAAVLLFVAVNIFRNVYGKTNRQIKRSENKLKECMKTNNFASFGASVPAAYKDQWEIFCENQSKKPSQIMRFSKIKRRKRCIAAVIVSGIVACWYAFLYFAFAKRVEYAIAPAVWALTVTWSVLLANVSSKRKLAKANKKFDKFVGMLDVCFGGGEYVKRDENKEETSDLADKIRAVRTSGSGDEALKRVAELLKDADAQRTCAQQKKVNSALNDLLLSVTSDYAFC